MVQNECGWAKKILPSPEDKLTRGTKEQILAHNIEYLKHCED